MHRDIKPANVFLADDDRLVLGDFGLVINPTAADQRLTDTYENVGSRDWMPGWAMGMRMDDVKPNFDVFSLGKVLWSMISGKQFLRLWYHHFPEFDLERLFPENHAMAWAVRVLDKCVVEHERDCSNNATELLAEVDLAIEALTHGAQILGKDRPLRCWICGLGSYTHKVRDDNTLTLACGHCGHMLSFHDPKNTLGAVNNSLPPLAKMAATFAISLSWTSALRRKKSPTQPRHQRFGRRKLSLLRRRTEPGLLGSSLEIPRSCWLRHPLHTRCNHVQSRLGKLVCPSHIPSRAPLHRQAATATIPQRPKLPRLTYSARGLE